MNNNPQTVFITAGGTGGHIFPALTTAKAIINDKTTVIWIGANHGIENDIIPKNDIKLETIKISGLRNKGYIRLLKFPFILFRACFSAYMLLRKYRPKLVISFGGYVSFPVSIMARILGIPLIIHEQNSIMGLTNKILSKIANKTLVAYKTTAYKNAILVGNPVRQEINLLEPVTKRYQSRIGGLRVLVLGGSLGAAIFNDNLPDVFKNVNNLDYVIHQVGRGNIEEVEANYTNLNIPHKVVRFIDDIITVYQDVDLVICRAGALTVSEVCNIGVAAIFIPYPYAVDDHQTHNIKELVETGSALTIAQKDFTIPKLTNLINSLSRAKFEQMAIDIHKFAIPDSLDKIISHINHYLL